MKRQAILVATLLVFCVHAVVVLLSPSPVLWSNVVQLLTPLITIVLCLHEARYAQNLFFRRLWQQLSFAFLIWLVAQAFYLADLLLGQPPVFPSLADFLWMAFAFPIFVVISSTQETTQDVVSWLDIGQ